MAKQSLASSKARRGLGEGAMQPTRVTVPTTISIMYVAQIMGNFLSISKRYVIRNTSNVTGRHQGPKR